MTLDLAELRRLQALCRDKDIGLWSSQVCKKRELLMAVPVLLAAAEQLVRLKSALAFFADRGWWSASRMTSEQIIQKATELGWREDGGDDG